MPRASTSRRNGAAAVASSSSPAQEARSRPRATGTGSTSRRSTRSKPNDLEVAEDVNRSSHRSDSEDIDEGDDPVEEAGTDRTGQDVEAEEEQEEVQDRSRDTFYLTIYALVRVIPEGRVTTYGECLHFLRG